VKEKDREKLDRQRAQIEENKKREEEKASK